jgi:hypothetical protein
MFPCPVEKYQNNKKPSKTQPINHAPLFHRIDLEKSPQSHYFPSSLTFFCRFANVKRDEMTYTHISIGKHADKKAIKRLKRDTLQTLISDAIKNTF